MNDSSPSGAVDLYWIPLGAGRHFVRLNGKVYEAVRSVLERRRRLDLYHSALQVQLPEGRFALECAWVPSTGADSRGVVADGPVISRLTGHLRIFRYEVRCWRDGVIPDLEYAVGGPQRVTDDEDAARRLVLLAPRVPTPVWGRDELAAGEMWNSNSVISWLLESSGLNVEPLVMPHGGRAPGWNAGLTVARRRA